MLYSISIQAKKTQEHCIFLVPY